MEFELWSNICIKHKQTNANSRICSVNELKILGKLFTDVIFCFLSTKSMLVERGEKYHRINEKLGQHLTKPKEFFRHRMKRVTPNSTFYYNVLCALYCTVYRRRIVDIASFPTESVRTGCSVSTPIAKHNQNTMFSVCTMTCVCSIWW